MHDGQYRPLGIKYERKTRESCSDYSGTQTFNGLEAKEGDDLVPVRTYKQNIRKHMIRSGMWPEIWLWFWVKSEKKRV